MLQHIVHSDNENEDHCVPDHSKAEDRKHVNEWVVHVPKGKLRIKIATKCKTSQTV